MFLTEVKAGFRVDLASSILISDLSFQQQEKFDDMACKACGFVAQTWKQLQLHLMDHTNERPFKCDWQGCDYTSAAKVNGQGTCTHTGKKPFSATGKGVTFPVVLI